MASQGWLPMSDTGLRDFTGDFSAKLTAAPTTYGLTAADATAEAGLVTTYKAALATATDPATRTPVTITAKNVAKAGLVASTRSLAARIQANPSVTPEQKVALGLPVHITGKTPIPAPTTRPVVTVADITELTHAVRIVDESTPTKRAKPYGVAEAAVFTFVGDNPPADLEQWEFKGIAKRSDFLIHYDAPDAGKRAHIRAVWFNPRGEQGPVGEPASAMVAA